MGTRQDDHFERIKLAEAIERARGLIAQYDEGRADNCRLIEDSRYKIGRLDERLGRMTIDVDMTATDDTDIDAPIQALCSLIVDHRESWIAKVQSLADEAGERGDVDHQRGRLAYIAELRAKPYPWETVRVPVACCCGAHAGHSEPTRS
jgi:hypothetical protein